MRALLWLDPGDRLAGRLLAHLPPGFIAICLVIAAPLAAGTALADDPPSAGAIDRAKNEPQASDLLRALRIPVPSLLVWEMRPSWERPLPFAPDFTEAERQALWEFRKTCVLTPGESVKRIASPPLLGRTLDRVLFTMRNGADWQWMRNEWENNERTGRLSNQIYRWRHGEPVWVTGIITDGGKDPGTKLADLIGRISRLPPLAIEGDEDLRMARVSGDFITREGESLETTLPRLGEIIRRECKLPVRLAFRDVGRRVVVVRGRWKTGSPNSLDASQVVIAPAMPTELKLYSFNEGDFDGFLNRLGRQLEMLVAADAVEGIPKDLVWVSRYDRIPAKETGRVLEFLGKQTGLTFAETPRRVRILFVERAE